VDWGAILHGGMSDLTGHKIAPQSTKSAAGSSRPRAQVGRGLKSAAASADAGGELLQFRFGGVAHDDGGELRLH
jgi:hypothetical protein